MSKQKVLDKIRKCLALSESSNPHEAAAALRQAQALMRKHEVDSVDVAMSEITEAGVKASGTNALPLWEHGLACCVSDICGCKVMFAHGARSGRHVVSGRHAGFIRQTYKKGSLLFIGRKDRVELAGYSFETLRRQLRKARKEFTATYQVTPVQVDAFASGWVQEVAGKVRDLVAPLADAEMIEAYMRRKNDGRDTESAKVKDKAGLMGGRVTDKSVAAAFRHGVATAGDVQLHAGVGAAAPLQIEHGGEV